MQHEVVDVPADDLPDYCEGGISLKDFLDGVYFAAGCVMFIVGLEDMVNLVEEVALRGDPLHW